MAKDAFLFALVLVVGATGYYGKLRYDDWQSDLRWKDSCAELPDRVRLPLSVGDKALVNICVEDGHIPAQSDLAWRARPAKS